MKFFYNLNLSCLLFFSSLLAMQPISMEIEYPRPEIGLPFLTSTIHYVIQNHTEATITIGQTIIKPNETKVFSMRSVFEVESNKIYINPLTGIINEELLVFQANIIYEKIKFMVN